MRNKVDFLRIVGGFLGIVGGFLGIVLGGLLAIVLAPIVILSINIPFYKYTEHYVVSVSHYFGISSFLAIIFIVFCLFVLVIVCVLIHVFIGSKPDATEYPEFQMLSLLVFFPIAHFTYDHFISNYIEFNIVLLDILFLFFSSIVFSASVCSLHQYFVISFALFLGWLGDFLYTRYEFLNIISNAAKQFFN
jgi:hypothetical protein